MHNVAKCFREEWPDVREHNRDQLTMPELLGRLGAAIQYLALEAEKERRDKSDPARIALRGDSRGHHGTN